jgi:succinate-semialdehyde dehydrogenase/glutarate-semialdehyde dehydrogenase
MNIYENYIDGQWVRGGGELKDVISPSTGEIIGQLSMGTPEDVDRAVKAAKRELPKLEKLTVFERAAMLTRISDALEKQKDKISRLLTMEHGKPIGEAIGEVEASINAYREVSEQIKWMDSTIIPVREANKLCLVFRRPIGVFGIITPWNYPIGTVSMYYLAAGLAAACPIVWNPATSTAAVASTFMQCIEDADIPSGFVSMVIGFGSVVGDALSVHPLVSGIGFTGSTEVGNIICSRAKAKHTQMELGGNGPSIVLRDADLELTAEKLMRGSFTNAGQICTSTERVLVDEAVADELVSIVSRKMSDYVLGDPFDPKTTMGPIHSKPQIKIILDHIQDALAKGAKLIVGGKRQDGSPTEHYILPTVLDNVPIDSLVNTDETFGPVLPFIRFKDESEIPSLINMSPYRLFGSIFTRDIDKALVMAQQYNFGSMHINEGSNCWDTMMPAGGGGGSASGFGRSGGKYSIEDFSETRVVLVNLQTKL